MKTEEDEAFEELERRQGGFQAKRAMAADKQREWAGLTEADIENCIHKVEKNGINVFDLVRVIEAKLKEKNND
jgi:hypothetical protein